MPGKRKQINMHGLYVNRHAAKSLYRIGMERNALIVADLANLFDGLDGADLVVGKHHTYQNRIRPNRLFHLFRRHKALFIYR